MKTPEQWTKEIFTVNGREWNAIEISRANFANLVAAIQQDAVKEAEEKVTAPKPSLDCEICKGSGTYKVLGSGGDYGDVACICLTYCF